MNNLRYQKTCYVHNVGFNCVCVTVRSTHSALSSLSRTVYNTVCYVLTQLNMCEDIYNTDIAVRSQAFQMLKIPLERKVQDFHVNNFGYKLIDFCKNNELYIVNSRIGNDKYTGGTTCKSSSTVDYVLSSVHMFAFFQDFDIVEFNNLYSDVHNPISFTVSSCNNTQTPLNDITGKTQPSVKLWSQDKAKDFCHNINTAAVNDIDLI